MLKVEFIPHSEECFSSVEKLQNALQNINDNGNDILYVTSDDRGYTIVYSGKERKTLNE